MDINSSSVILFFDTNKLFSLVRSRYSGGQGRKNSDIFIYRESLRFVVSTFVLTELQRVLYEKLSLTISMEDMKLFCHDIGLCLFGSTLLDQAIYEYVHDKPDGQILWDAYCVEAKYIITDNLKDFDFDMIKDDFDILVLKELPKELLDSK